MTELYGTKRLSVSSVTGGDYHGVSVAWRLFRHVRKSPYEWFFPIV